MACINEDGTVTPTARSLLEILSRPLAADEASAALALPLFRVRASLRELEAAGLVRNEGDRYVATEKAGPLVKNGP